MPHLKKIISGGQTGADQGGLDAGLILQLERGGTAPPGWITDAGPQQELLETGHGLVEGEPDSRIYPKRTRKNVSDADATLWIGNKHSPGGKMTLGEARRLNKPVLINPTVDGLAIWLQGEQIEILNVAGNRERTNPSVYDETRNLITDAVRKLRLWRAT